MQMKLYLSQFLSKHFMVNRSKGNQMCGASFSENLNESALIHSRFLHPNFVDSFSIILYQHTINFWAIVPCYCYKCE